MMRFNTGGGTGSFRLRTSFQLMPTFVKNSCALISSASPLPEPSRFCGLRFRSCRCVRESHTYRHKESFGFIGKELGQLQWAHLDVLVKLLSNRDEHRWTLLVIGVVGRDTDEHFVKKDSQQVPVN